MKKLVFQSHFLVQIFSVDEVNKCVWEMFIFDFLSHKQQQNSFFVKILVSVIVILLDIWPLCGFALDPHQALPDNNV